MKTDTILDALSGNDIFFDQDHIDQYHIDDMQPIAVVGAQSEDQVTELLQGCHRHHCKVNVWGSGRHQQLGGVPEAHELALDVSRLDHIIETEPENLSATVQCGVRLSGLQSRLAQSGLFLPINAPFNESTLGGLVSVNAYGDWVHGYGTFRDLVLGGKAILANGSDIQFGGKTVKNVAGYDMAKLFIGAMGTLGVLTELTLKLSPIPDKVLTVQMHISAPNDIAAISSKINASGLPVRVFTYFQKNNEQTSLLTVKVHCRAQETGVFQDALQKLLAMPADMTITDWAQDAQISSPLQALVADPAAMIIKWIVPISHFPRVVDIVNANNPGATLFGYPGRGVLYALCAGASCIENAVQQVPAWRSQAHNLEGRLVVIKAPASVKPGLNIWDVPEAELNWYRKLKSEFDPGAIFLSGRFVQ